MLDPVKAQERASELMQKAEEEREMRENLEKQQREKFSEERKPSLPSSRNSLTPEDAMNALDGKPLPKPSVREEKPVAATVEPLQKSEPKNPSTTGELVKSNESKSETAISKTMKESEESMKHVENTVTTTAAPEHVISNQTATFTNTTNIQGCLLYTSPSPRDS